MKINEEETPKKNLNFIEAIVDQDVKEGKNGGRVQTRFPPEPNGYLHIGHAKAICLNFDIAKRYGGICNLRFDDTNPVKEDVEYVDSIMEDIQWLGYQWENVYYASDYFQKLWDLAVQFIKKGLAYVDEQSAETIAKQKGTPTVPGIESPYRNRPVEENLALFQKMTDGEIPEGSMVLRAKIDMASPNMHFRDPIMYRIITSHPHHRTGWQWKVYPMYDFAHGQCDYFEGVTHSLCTLEFEVHRPLYDWFIDQYQDSDYRPRQIEFNRLNLTYTVMSKRKLLQLVQEKFVSGWDDPRMPTLCGLRRRGFTPESIHNFIDKIGYTKFEALNDIGLLEHAARESLNKTATRVNAVLHPVKLIVTNYPEGKVEMMTTQNNPEDPEAGTREVAFSRELFIERDDFMENPPKNYFRLTPGQEVRLKSAYIVKCTGCKKDDNGEIMEVYCEYDPLTKSGMPESNRKVKGTLHWVSAAHCVDAEVRLYDRLFNVENPSADERDFRELLNPDSLQILTGCKLENSLKNVHPLEHFQFQRIGYFTVDLDSTPNKLIFNRTVSLKDSWSKELNK
ncbi:MAG TPA: glutamine--tRNA ligase/YqeY domain fusion protein [Paludibacteraceae bacterium]|jgi:glutaminyl-tRNA synthetase|nr:glutamine--tRNA ligase/YqeY domain fusion protein [Porphyromonadaceae sp. NP-X]HOH55928.1 glutamine--tRNA ligase/YqeY domain fusion protein [Paludibacteraceae bacterium]